eukprot:gene17052-18769_t
MSASIRRRNVGKTTKNDSLMHRLVHWATDREPRPSLQRGAHSLFPFSTIGQRASKRSWVLNILAFILVLAGSCYLFDYIRDIYDESMVAHDVEVTRLFVEVPCSDDYGSKFKRCLPRKCGRCVMDNIFDEGMLESLRNIAIKGLAHGGSTGGASILDLHSGALSKGERFINIYKLKDKVFTGEDFAIYRKMKNAIKQKIAQEFEVPESELYLTSPTFFSRMDTKPSKTKHDEYWHTHIDKITYKTFYYTSLLYLADYGTDFMGGRFVFVGKRSNKTVEPKRGRLSFFTSGSENPHYVEKVVSGTRYAITVSFTCDKSAAIKDPGQDA